MSGQTCNENQTLNNDEIFEQSSFHPWQTVVRGRSTCTANAFDIQHTLKSENQTLISRKDIAEALHKRNILRQTKVIQLSSNLKYISIQFETSMLMETFCTDPLTVRDYSITFKPDFRKNNFRYQEPETISFLNVPSEADEDSMTQFVQQYAVVIGQPRYPTETINDIQYLTGTRIYRVHSRREHIPRIIKLFGRQIQCIYTKQPEQQEWLLRKKREEQRRQNASLQSDEEDSTQQNSDMETETEEDHDTQNSDSETETMQDNQKHIEKQHDSENNTENQNNRKPTKMTINPEIVINYTSDIEDNTDEQNEEINNKSKSNQNFINNPNVTKRKSRPQKNQNNNNKQLYYIDNLPPQLSQENYPPLTTNKNQNDAQQININIQSSQNKTIIEETPISQQPTNEEDDIDSLTPPVVSKPFRSTTPKPIDTPTPTTTQIQTKQVYNKEIIMPKLYKKGKIIKQETIHGDALKMTQRLAKLSYRDVGFLSNATEDERRRIIALSMYYQIGRYDPSNPFIRTHSNKDIITLVKKYTTEKLHKMNALTNIYLDIYAIEQRIEQNKIDKNNDKNKDKNTRK